jgi:hypothetical protein
MGVNGAVTGELVLMGVTVVVVGLMGRTALHCGQRLSSTDPMPPHCGQVQNADPD